MSFSAGGLISGLDTNSIIDQLVQIDRLPITQLQSKQQGFQAQISAIGRVKASLDSMISAMKGLDTTDEVLSLNGTTTNEDAFTVKAAASATLGTYSMEVTELAAAAKQRSVGFTDSVSDAVQAGTLSFSIKGGDAIDVTIDEGDTLGDIAFKINQQVDGISAAIVSDGTSSYLSITNDETGHEIGQDPSSALQITESYTGATGSQLGLTQIQAAQNAQVTIDGLAVESETNAISTAVSGVTITLLNKTTQVETLGVEPNTDQVKENIEGFVSAYNDVLLVLNRETTVSQNTNRTATLGSDPTLRGLRASLSEKVTGAIASLADGTFDSLASIGIKTNTSGNLEITTADLEEALEANLSAVASVFTADDGLADTLVTMLEPYTDLDGILAAREDGIEDSIKAIETRIESMELRSDRYRTQLVRQFTAMENSLSLINQQQSSLAGIA